MKTINNLRKNYFLYFSFGIFLLMFTSCSDKIIYLKDQEVYRAEYEKNNNKAKKTALVKSYNNLPRSYRISAITTGDKYSAVGLFKNYEDGYVEVFDDKSSVPILTLTDSQIINFTDYNGDGSIVVDSMDLTGPMLEINFKITGGSPDIPESPLNSVVVDIRDPSNYKYFSAVDGALEPMDNYLKYDYRSKKLTNPNGILVQDVPLIDKFDANF
jgi:hypothetical protein